ncbi:complex I NDUFA9 subunit family protein [Azospirillum halopraeferens]|uniref:complex I NDUFA9 subunit family protein n=1 Tax=Azospirillum halopraeferens TaxID=34010 RepID=UPI000411B4B5|nr:complex I NDUFA9 subunit family protein [Azospirillum halopraeferens]
MSYRNKIVTVFGGSGFIGRHLIRRLARTGAVIRVAVRRPAGANFLKTAGAVGQIVPIACDIRKDESVALALKGADLVVNLTGTLYEREPWTFRTVHVDGPARIARLAKAAGVQRLVHISAIGADARGAAGYARSKAAGEAAVLEAFPEATILRPSIVFGPEDQFFNRFAAMAQVSPVLPLIGGGKTRFQPVYVGDVADAIVGALTADDAAGRTYELGGPGVYTFRQLMERMLGEIRRKRLLVPVPWGAAGTLGGILEKVPLGAPLLTRDQVEMLRHDNVVAADAPGLKELGVTPTALEVILPTYLFRFIVGGRSPMSNPVELRQRYPE